MVKDIIESNNSIQPGSKELDVLRENFPACFHTDGTFDLARFKEYLTDKVDVTSEGYELRFLGKNYARLLASIDTTTVVVPDEEHNAQPENKDSKNIYISGDNIDALKHLLKSYAGKIKCIYIDPPYNTGSDGFVYNDSFNFTAEELSTRLSIDEEEAARILDLTRRGSASHSAWLMFMLPRLVLARDLLTADGVIFISIDDNEQSNLKLLCDDVFGEEKFVCQFIWEKRLNRENRAEVSIRHDYVLCYSMNINTDFSRLSQLPMNDKALSSYSNPDNDPRGPWKSDPAHAQGGHGTKNQFYTLIAPNGNRHDLPSGRCWVYTQPVMEEAIKDNRIWFGKDGNGVPRIKTYLNTKDRGLTPETILFAKDCSTNEKAKNDLKELFNSCAVFETPKPVELIAYLLNMVLGKSDIALDFFSGSAATADAVMQLNRSDFGDRSYMCVQIPEATKEDSEAYANGYKTIDQIGIERIKRAADKIKRESPLFHGDLGFKHYTLKEPSAKALEQMEAFDPHVVLATNTLAEEFGNATILTTWMVRDGYTLTPEMLVVDLCGYEAYHCDKHLYLIHTGLSTDAIDALVTKYEKEVAFNPINVVVYGYAFTWSELQALKDNLRRLSVTDKNIRVNIDIRY